MAFTKKGAKQAPKKGSSTAASTKTLPRPVPKGMAPMVDSESPQMLAKGGMAKNCYADGGRVAAMCFTNGPGGAKTYKK